MALLMPQTQLARNIDTILSQIRKGCARARIANQGDPTLGIMVDLPDGVEFEITVIREYQALSRVTNVTSNDTTSVVQSRTSNDTASVVQSENSADTTSVAQSRITGNEKSSETIDETANEAGSEEKSQEISKASQQNKASNVATSSTSNEDSKSNASQTARKTADETTSEDKDNRENTLITEGKTESDEQSAGKSLKTTGTNNDFSQNSRGYDSFDEETGVRGGELNTYGLNVPPMGSCGIKTQ